MAHKEFIRHTDGDEVVLFVHGFLESPEPFEQCFAFGYSKF